MKVTELDNDNLELTQEVQQPDFAPVQEQAIEKKKAAKGGILPFLVVLLVLVGIFDLVLGIYVGYYYLTTGNLSGAKGGVVYISEADGKYHYNPNCGIIEASLEQAKLKGLTPCEKCAK